MGRPGTERRRLGRPQPHDLAPRLRGVDLFVSAGNGQPGPLDGPAPDAQAQQIEADLYPQSLAFVERLGQLGIPVRFDDYGPGTHDWPYWERMARLYQKFDITVF